MHLKLIFCIVFLQLLLIVYAEEDPDPVLAAGEPDSGAGDKPDVDSAEKSVNEEEEEATVDKRLGAKIKMSGKKISGGLHCAPERAVAVDLTRGWCRYLPRSTREAWWTVFPRCTCQRCNMQGVMCFRQPFWAHVLTVLLVFEHPRKYSFNLGNSETNNAWGGDGRLNPWDAEIHNWYHKLYMWRNQFGGHQLLFFHPFAVRTALLIRIHRFGVYITNYENVSVFKCSYRFFKMWPRNCVCMGFNRVIKHAHGAPSPSDRTGSGLCYMSLFWSM